MGDAIFDSNELSWGDVVGVLRGLGEWFGERNERGERGIVVWFRAVEEGEGGRGQVGDGHLTRREVEAVEKNGFGEIREGRLV